jgi:hypothetical protein
MFEEEILSFPCPNCRELINNRMKECRFCGTPIDQGIARQVGETQRNVNRAFSDAGYIKNAAFLMWGLLAVSLIPFVPWVSWGFLFTFLAVIVLLIRWYLKYGQLNTSDPDYQKARSSIHLALVLWLAALPVAFLIKPLIAAKVFGVAS